MPRTPISSRLSALSVLSVLSSSTLCIVLGCGDDSIVLTNTADATATTEPTGPTEPTSAGTSSATTGSSSGPTATQGETENNSATTSTSTSGTTDATTSTSTNTNTNTNTGTTTGSTTDITTGTTTEPTTGTGGSEDADYAARYVAGGLDRIFIRKAEKLSGLCTHLGLVWPGFDDEPYTITTPMGWGVESASIAEGLTGCLDFEPLAQPIVGAATGNGSVAWADEDLCPLTLDVEVTLQFIAGDLLWVPMKDQLTTSELPVEGCF